MRIEILLQTLLFVQSIFGILGGVGADPQTRHCEATLPASRSAGG